MKPDKQQSFKRMKDQARDNYCSSFQRLSVCGLRRCLEEAKQRAREKGDE